MSVYIVCIYFGNHVCFSFKTCTDSDSNLGKPVEYEETTHAGFAQPTHQHSGMMIQSEDVVESVESEIEGIL